MGCPELWLLQNPTNTWSFAHKTSNRVRSMTDDDRHSLGIHGLSDSEDVLDEALPTETMKYLGHPRLHSGALPSREDDYVNI